MAQSGWLDKIIDALRDAGAILLRDHTGSNKQMWALGKRRITIPQVGGRDAGHARRNYEVTVAREIALHFKENPGLQEQMERQRELKRKGMSPKDVDKMVPLGPPTEMHTLTQEEIKTKEDQMEVVNNRSQQEPESALTPSVDWNPVPPELIPLSSDALTPEPILDRLQTPSVQPTDHSQTVEDEEPIIMPTGAGQKGKAKGVGQGRKKCPYCQRDFGAPQALGRHISHQHPENMADYREKYTLNKSARRNKLRVGLPVMASAGPKDSKTERKVPALDAEKHLLEVVNTLMSLFKEFSEIFPKVFHDYQQIAAENAELQRIVGPIRDHLTQKKQEEKVNRIGSIRGWGGR